MLKPAIFANLAVSFPSSGKSFEIVEAETSIPCPASSNKAPRA